MTFSVVEGFGQGTSRQLARSSACDVRTRLSQLIGSADARLVSAWGRPLWSCAGDGGRRTVAAAGRPAMTAPHKSAIVASLIGARARGEQGAVASGGACR